MRNLRFLSKILSISSTVVLLAALTGCIQDPSSFESAAEGANQTDRDAGADVEADADVDTDAGKDVDDTGPQCAAHESICSGACHDLQTSVDHCGDCDTACTTAVEGAIPVCQEGSCTDECLEDLTRCNGSCKDLLSDPENCGACNVSCATGSCTDGQCDPLHCDSSENDDDFGGGEGTEDAPYTICTAEHLNNIRHHADQHFALSADIDLTQFEFDPIGFEGFLDGFGYSITGFQISDDSEDVGLFSIIHAGAEVKNLNISDATVTGENRVGLLAGSNAGTITTVTSSGTVSGNRAIGGLVGRNEYLMENTSSDATVTASHSRAGGLVGYNASGEAYGFEFDGEIDGGHASGIVHAGGDGETGGLVGRNTGQISNSTAHAQVTSDGDALGGLVGLNDTDTDSTCIIDNSSAAGDINISGSREYIGGLVGHHRHDCQILNSHATGDVTALNSQYVGGLVGYTQEETRIIDSYAEGNVSADDYAGGLVGRAQGEGEPDSIMITGVHALGSATATTYAGGLIGRANNGVTIRDCFAHGNASVTEDRAGGLIGRIDHDVEVHRCFATGNVTGAEDLGGLIGYVRRNSNRVVDTYATGTVSGGVSAGGLIGYHREGEVRRSYSTGAASGGDNVGGLIGRDGGDVYSSFWDVETSGIDDDDDSDTGEGITTQQFSDPAFFEDEDNDDPWHFSPDDGPWVMPDASQLSADEEPRPRLYWEFQ